jgi:hypothetical protein
MSKKADHHESLHQEELACECAESVEKPSINGNQPVQSRNVPFTTMYNTYIIDRISEDGFDYWYPLNTKDSIKTQTVRQYTQRSAA